ncbi:AIM24 family protein [Pararhodospirillum oryzae]|uniref:Transcriptional regulator n=1 Tax=Pararhodospirillum oryzae TaxID=478448 RepID=A0A512H9L6_9PROT|nr:AIM24 family protein [Pararhodospirillum oryzae]GEO82146.1 transcriptional regulator [Pararhodospirillum oryzae]
MTDPTGVTITERHEQDGIVMEILEWSRLGGMTDPAGLPLLALMRTAELPVRQLRLTLTDAAVVLEAGALQAWHGRIEVENTIPAGRLLRRMVGSALSGERLFRPRYSGTGVVLTEPLLQCLLPVGLQDETVIVDQGLFLACSGGIEVGAAVQRTGSALLFGGEGLVQTRLSGTGFAVLQSPVPDSELIKVTLKKGETMAVDGPFAVLRSGSVRFSVGKSAKTWFGTAVSGEGLMQILEGPGDVWLSPLQPVYDGFAALARTLGPDATEAAESGRRR